MDGLYQYENQFVNFHFDFFQLMINSIILIFKIISYVHLFLNSYN